MFGHVSMARLDRASCLFVLALAWLAFPHGIASAQTPTAPAAADPGWPREVTKDGSTLVYYQPQLDDWKDYRQLSGRVAFSLTPKGGTAVLGVASLSAKTQTDMEARTVVVKSIEVTGTRFPSLPSEHLKSADGLFRELFPTNGLTVSLDRVLAGIERGEESAKPVAVKNDPPPIFTSERPAVLLFVDGEPVRAPVEGTGITLIVNTNWILFHHEAGGQYYLLQDDAWLSAPELKGPWAVTKSLPEDFSKLPAGDEFADVRAAVPPKPGATAAQVFFTSAPGELLEFDGAPVWTAIGKTQLLFAKNSDGDAFVHKQESQYYVLLSGRWFRAKSLQGPWSWAGGNLPADFKAIPHDHPKYHVLASVPGTQEAADAVLLAQIPSTAVVNRAEAEAKVKVVYDGDPKFAPIEKTSVQYATNTPEKVLLAGGKYYLCYQAVWFVGSSPNGPWKVAEMIPAEIYSIPPSSPAHSVTYVYVTDPTPTTVTVSYTSGYTGVYVVGAPGGMTVVYGSGWYYPPYMYYPPHYGYPVYHPYPYTYCASARYNPYTGGYAVGHAAYGPYGGYGSAATYNPATGRYGRAATVQTPYGGRTAAQTYNPYTGVRASTVQGSSPYGQWGSTTVQRGNDWATTNRVTTNQGTVRHTETSSGASGTTVKGPGGTTKVVSDGDNNVYAGKDGNVYKKDASGDWQKYDNGSWSGVTPPASSGAKGAATAQPAGGAGASTQPASGTKPSAQPATGSKPSAQPASGSQPTAKPAASGQVPSDVQRDASARKAGAERSQQASQSSSASRGGASRGGGGRRR